MCTYILKVYNFFSERKKRKYRHVDSDHFNLFIVQLTEVFISIKFIFHTLPHFDSKQDNFFFIGIKTNLVQNCEVRQTSTAESNGAVDSGCIYEVLTDFLLDSTRGRSSSSSSLPLSQFLPGWRGGVWRTGSRGRPAGRHRYLTAKWKRLSMGDCPSSSTRCSQVCWVRGSAIQILTE